MIHNSKQLNLFQDHLNNEIDLSIFGGIKNVNAKEVHRSVRDLMAKLTLPRVSQSKDTFLFGPYKLGPAGKRSNQNVQHVSALVFDIDNAQGYSFDDLISITSQYCGILHTTWSHTEENPRYRLVIHLARPLTANNFTQVRSNFLFFNPELSLIIDQVCSEISRAYYVFSYPEERREIAQCCVLMGRPINPEDYLIKTSSALPNIPSSKANTPLAEIMGGGFKEGNRNAKLAALLGGYIAKGLNKDQTLDLAIEWNKTLQPPLDHLELTRTHESIWKTHLRNHPEDADKQSAKPINENAFTLIPASKLLESLPPKREWIIQDFLPNKIVGSIIAAGGTGKSFLAMHIAVSVSSGSSLFGKYLPTAPSKVIFISGEDDLPELQRRLHKATKGLPPYLGRNIDQNLHFIDLADSFELFTERSSKGEVSITQVPNLICSQIKGAVGDGIGLVIIDPVSRFRGGEENLAADTTRFVQALQIIRDQLNTCVLTLHHVNKNAGTNGASQNNARGSSAFIDGVRLVYQLNPLSDSELKKYGDTSTLPKLLTLQSVKSNYGKPIDPLLLSRCDDGSLELFNAVAGDHLKRAILQEIKLSKISKTKFKETYGDAKGKFSLSEKAMLRTLDEFEVEKLIKIPNRGVMVLTELGESLLTT